MHELAVRLGGLTLGLVTALFVVDSGRGTDALLGLSWWVDDGMG